jgi:sulfide:quinone oxidoreductase
LVSPVRVLIAGVGVAGLEALLALRRLAEERVEVELLAADPRFRYRPLSVGEPFGLGELHDLDLRDVAEELGARLTVGTLEAVDGDAHVARTSAGPLPYDVLLVAVGATAVAAVPGALTFRGSADAEAFRTLLEDLAAGRLARVVFALPGAVAWPLPLYELALQTAAHVQETGADVRLALVTPEEQPLELLGPAASEKVAELLAERNVELLARTYPGVFENGLLQLRPEGSVAADRVVALPRLEGPRIDGLPLDANGFIPTDASGRVQGLGDVFAAGDATSFPIKQGGIAAQQADAVAEEIAAAAGADLVPQPFRPVLRGLVLTGDAPIFARVELAELGPPFDASTDALWWPPGKIVGRRLAPYLAERSGTLLTRPNLTSLGA